MGITKAQYDFINSDDKFIRLLAPAGCGKTFSIVEKTKKILEKNQKAKIKIFTFTKNAAEELKGRCPAASGLDILTLNSWGNSYLKRKLHNPRKIEEDEKKFYVSNTLKSIWIKTAYVKRFEPILTGKKGTFNGPIILDRICDFKNIGFNHTDFTKDFDKNIKIYEKHMEFIKEVNLNKYYRTIRESLIRLLMRKKKLTITEQEQDEFIVRNWIPFWKDCCEEMIDTDRFLFDDQKYIPNISLEEQLRKKEHWSGKTKIDYIFVDEFQDISPLDLTLISNIQKLNDASLIIVGDDDQAIFEFRGATPYFILHSDEIFGHQFKTFALDENFRSPKNIVEKSMKLIKHNIHRFDKDVKANPEKEDANINLYEFENPKDMVDTVINDIKNTNPNEKVVVLSRKKSSLLPYQILLTRDKIDYKVSDDLAFFYTSAARNLNKAFEIKLKKNLQAPDFVELICMFSKNEIYKKAKDTLSRALLANCATIEKLPQILLFLGQKNIMFEHLFTFDYVSDFTKAITAFISAKSVYDTIYILLNLFNGFHKNYFRALEDLYYKDPPLSSLLSFADKYGNDFENFVFDFNTAISRASCANDEEDLVMENDSNVLLSTALRVKGQEFEKVIVLDVIDKVWPIRQKTNDDDDVIVLDDLKLSDCKNIDSDTDDIESERRLFYVAATRSKKELHFYRTTKISDNVETDISPFILEGDYDK